MSLTSQSAGFAFHKNPTSHASFSQSELAELWVNNGGPQNVADVAAAIAMAESGGKTKAHNPSGASGLWQILGQVVGGNIYDPNVNAKNAVKKYRDAGNSFSPWVTYTSGAYEQFLNPHLKFKTGTTTKLSGIPGLEQAEEAINTTEEAGEFLVKMGETLLDFRKLGNLAVQAFAWFIRLLGKAIWDYVIAPMFHWGERAVSFYWINFFGTGTEQGSGFGYQLRNNAGAITILFWSVGYAILWTDGKSAVPIASHESMFGQGVRAVTGTVARRNLIKPSKVKEKTPKKPEPKTSKAPIAKVNTFAVGRNRPVRVHTEGRVRNGSSQRFGSPVPRPERTEKIVLPPGVKTGKAQRPAKAQSPAKPGGPRVGPRTPSSVGT